jgi:GNAT superfamily N-acetyltransferase
MLRRDSSPVMARRASIRRSTDVDLDRILRWLKEESPIGVTGNFWCNRERIRDSHKQRDLIVYIDRDSREPVAFLLGGLVYEPGIMEVRHAYRGRGIGSRLVTDCISRARKKNQPLLFIQCMPTESLKFWKKMGFTPILGENDDLSGYRKVYAYRVLEHKFKVPEASKRVSVRVAFFHEKRKWPGEEETPPLAEFSPEAFLLEDGIIQLAERISFHERIFPRQPHGGNDTVVQIEIDEIVVYIDKARYEEAAVRGVRRCVNGYYIDSIRAVGA